MGKLSEDFPHTSRIPACQWVYYRILNSLQLANHGYPHWRSTLNKTQAETKCQGGNGRAACLLLTLLREQDRRPPGMHEINMRKRKNSRNAAATHIALCNVAFWSLKNKSRFQPWKFACSPCTKRVKWGAREWGSPRTVKQEESNVMIIKIYCRNLFAKPTDEASAVSTSASCENEIVKKRNGDWPKQDSGYYNKPDDENYFTKLWSINWQNSKRMVKHKKATSNMPRKFDKRKTIFSWNQFG